MRTRRWAMLSLVSSHDDALYTEQYLQNSRKSKPYIPPIGKSFHYSSYRRRSQKNDRRSINMEWRFANWGYQTSLNDYHKSEGNNRNLNLIITQIWAMSQNSSIPHHSQKAQQYYILQYIGWSNIFGAIRLDRHHRMREKTQESERVSATNKQQGCLSKSKK